MILLRRFWKKLCLKDVSLLVVISPYILQYEVPYAVMMATLLKHIQPCMRMCRGIFLGMIYPEDLPTSGEFAKLCCQDYYK